MLHDSSIFVKKILRRFASRQDTTKTNYENNEYCSDSAMPLPEKTDPKNGNLPILQDSSLVLSLVKNDYPR